jgi:hypothetical protein
LEGGGHYGDGYSHRHLFRHGFPLVVYYSSSFILVF